MSRRWADISSDDDEEEMEQDPEPEVAPATESTENEPHNQCDYSKYGYL